MIYASVCVYVRAHETIAEQRPHRHQSQHWHKQTQKQKQQRQQYTKVHSYTFRVLSFRLFSLFAATKRQRARTHTRARAIHISNVGESKLVRDVACKHTHRH